MQVLNAIALVALDALSDIVIEIVDDFHAFLVRHIALCGDSSNDFLHEHHVLMRFHIVKLTVFNLLTQLLDVNMHAIRIIVVAPLIGVSARLLSSRFNIASFFILRGG